MYFGWSVTVLFGNVVDLGSIYLGQSPQLYNYNQMAIASDFE